MQVTQYVFQSPYPNSVQFGRIDPSTKQDDSGSNSSTPAPVKAKTFGEILQKNDVNPQKVAPTVESKQTLDVYA